MQDVVKDLSVLVVASLFAVQGGALWAWRSAPVSSRRRRAAFILAPLPVVAAGAYLLHHTVWVFPIAVLELVLLIALARRPPSSWWPVVAFLVVAWVYAGGLIAAAAWIGVRYREWSPVHKGAWAIAECAGFCLAAPVFRRPARRTLAAG